MTYELIQFGFFKGLLALHIKWGEETLEAAQKKIQSWDAKPGKKFVLLDIRAEAELNHTEIASAISLLRDHDYFVILWVNETQNHALWKTAQATEVWLHAYTDWPQHAPRGIILVPNSDPATAEYFIGEHLRSIPMFIAWDNGSTAKEVLALTEKLPFATRVQRVSNLVKVELNESA